MARNPPDLDIDIADPRSDVPIFGDQPGINLNKPLHKLNGHAPAADIITVIDPRAPLDIAHLFVNQHFTNEIGRTLQHQQSVFTRWIGTVYREYSNEEVRARLYNFLEKIFIQDKKGLKPFKPTSRTVSDVLDSLRAACQLAGELRQPAWLLSSPAPAVASEIIACQNGLLHLPSGKLFRHTPAFWSNTVLPYNYDPKAGEPQYWYDFLTSIWEDDRAAIDTLQEIFGYLLGSNTDQQKIPLVVGPKRSGKGTIARTLTAMVGPDAVASPTLPSLEGQFGIAPLLGKSIALISDARLGGRADQQVVAERLLSISGEDSQTVNRKHLDAWSGKLGTRFFIMTNELPRITDASGALASRFLILTMTKSFLGQEDHDLTNKLLAELPGILNWAIIGWRRLKDNGRFMQPASSNEAMQELEDLSSPTSAFVRECCDIAPGKLATPTELYAAWQTWCAEQGRKYEGAKSVFCRDLRSAFPWLTLTQTGDDRSRKYQGIALKPERVISSGFGY
jgi:putative DNA primase/helicase